MSNKLRILLFLGGAICIFIACLTMFKPFSPNSFQSKTVFELGILADQVGEVSIIREKENISSESGIKIYSGDLVTLKDNSEVSVNIGDDRLSIIGPAKFEIAFPKKDSRDVFLNFSSFTKTEIIDEKPEHLWVTFNNWYVEPGFSAETTKAEDFKAYELPPEKIEKEEVSKAQAPKKENQETNLEEAIAVKRPLLKRCYENYLKKNPQATGDLVVEFVVQTTGKVSASRIAKSSFINDSLFKSCIRDVFRKVKTKPFSGEPLSVTYPIGFE